MGGSFCPAEELSLAVGSLLSQGPASSWNFTSLLNIPTFLNFLFSPAALYGDEHNQEMVGDSIVTYPRLGGHRGILQSVYGVWHLEHLETRGESTVSSRAVTVLASRVVAVAVTAQRVRVDHPCPKSTGALLHPSDGWEWDLLLLDHAQVISP